MFLTIYTGTTNTRIYLVDGETVKDSIKINAGAGDTAKTGSNQILKESIQNGICRLLSDNTLKEQDICAVFASGMITSELGLCEVPHVTAPATPLCLKEHAKTVLLSDVVSIPITFIPGVKNNTDFKNLVNLNEMDMMRGEETELFGLMKLLKVKPPFTAVLPGSHTKFVAVGNEGQILSCRTTLGGELLAALSEHTILNNSLPKPLISNIVPECLNAGFEYSRAHGLSDAAFRVRLIHNFTNLTENERANFFAGAVLASDIQALGEITPETKVLVGGSDPLRGVFIHLLKTYTRCEVIAASDEAVKLSTVYGVLELFYLE